MNSLANGKSQQKLMTLLANFHDRSKERPDLVSDYARPAVISNAGIGDLYKLMLLNEVITMKVFLILFLISLYASISIT